MPIDLHATLNFDADTITELVQDHVSSMGYYVKSVQSDEDTGGYTVSVRPMTDEERVLHNLPTSSVEERIYAALVEKDNKLRDEVMEVLDIFLTMASDTLSEHALTVEELMKKAEQRLSAPPVSKRDAYAERAPAVPAPPPVALTKPAPSLKSLATLDVVDDVGHASAPTFESLSFADAVDALKEADAAAPKNDHVKKRYDKLHQELAEEAYIAEEREFIPGESIDFPSDLATN